MSGILVVLNIACLPPIPCSTWCFRRRWVQLDLRHRRQYLPQRAASKGHRFRTSSGNAPPQIGMLPYDDMIALVVHIFGVVPDVSRHISSDAKTWREPTGHGIGLALRRPYSSQPSLPCCVSCWSYGLKPPWLPPLRTSGTASTSRLFDAIKSARSLSFCSCKYSIDATTTFTRIRSNTQTCARAALPK